MKQNFDERVFPLCLILVIAAVFLCVVTPSGAQRPSMVVDEGVDPAALRKDRNLSDLTNAAAAVSNLGLPSSATITAHIASATGVHGAVPNEAIVTGSGSFTFEGAPEEILSKVNINGSYARIGAKSNTNISLFFDLNGSTVGGTLFGLPIANMGQIYYDGASGLLVRSAGNSPIYFITNNQLRAWLDANGNASFSQGFYAAGAASFASQVTMAGASMTQNLVLNLRYLSGDGDNEGIAITGTGAVGIGTALPARRFHVYQTGEAQAAFSGWNFLGANSPYNGAIVLGENPSYQGRIHYSSNGNTALYVENSYDTALAGIAFRLRTAATAVTMGVIMDGRIALGVNPTVNVPTVLIASGVVGFGRDDPQYLIDALATEDTIIARHTNTGFGASDQLIGNGHALHLLSDTSQASGSRSWVAGTVDGIYAVATAANDFSTIYDPAYQVDRTGNFQAKSFLASDPETTRDNLGLPDNIEEMTSAASTTLVTDHTNATTNIHGSGANTRFRTASEVIPITNGGTNATGSPFVSVGLSTTNAVGNATDTLATYSLEIYDTENAFSISTFTAPVSGVYHCIAQCRWAADADSYRSIEFLVNGAAIPSVRKFTIVYPATNDIFVHQLGSDVYLSAGDQLTVSLSQNSGGNLNLLSGDTNLTISFVRSL